MNEIELSQKLAKEIFFSATVKTISEEETDISEDQFTLASEVVIRGRNFLGEAVSIRAFETDNSRVLIEKVHGIVPDITITLRPHCKEVPDDERIFSYPVLSLSIERDSEEKEDEDGEYHVRGFETSEFYDTETGEKTMGSGAVSVLVPLEEIGIPAYKDFDEVKAVDIQTLERVRTIIQNAQPTTITLFDIPPKLT